MDKHGKRFSTAIMGLIVLIITILAFFLLTEMPRTSLDWWGLFFIILSEGSIFAMLTYLMVSESASGVSIVRAGFLTVLSAYGLMTVILFFIRNMFESASFLTLNIFAMGVTGVVCLVLNMIAHHVKSSEEHVLRSKMVFEDLEKRVSSWPLDSRFTAYKEELSTLSEGFRFADKMGSTSKDQILLEEVEKLERLLVEAKEEAQELVKANITKVSSVLKQRNVELSQGKRGGV